MRRIRPTSAAALWRPVSKTCQSGRVLEPYCRCLWEEPVQKLSTEDIRSLPKLSPQQQLDKLGGSEAFLQRQEQCLAAQAKH